jgi:hypothetical protein
VQRVKEVVEASLLEDDGDALMSWSEFVIRTSWLGLWW